MSSIAETEFPPMAERSDLIIVDCLGRAGIALARVADRSPVAISDAGRGHFGAKRAFLVPRRNACARSIQNPDRMRKARAMSLAKARTPAAAPAKQTVAVSAISNASASPECAPECNDRAG